VQEPQASEGGPPPGTTAAPPLAAVAVLLALLCSALYVNTRAVPFISDDYPALVENPAVRWRELTLANARAALAQPQPVAQASYGLNYRLGRLDVHGYHAVNAALHFANAWLVYGLGLALLRRARGLGAEAAPWAALAGAGLFAAHPLQVEAVTWIAQRSGLLASLFGLAALVAYLRARSASGAIRVGLFTASATCWILAIGSHKTALALPAAVALCEWAIAQRGALRWLPAALAAALFAGVIALHQAGAIALYQSLALLPFPARQSIVHAVPDGVLVIALHAALLGGAVASALRFPLASFGVLWFYLWQVAAAVGAPLGSAAEHRNYLALAGPALAVAGGLFAVFPRKLGLATALAMVALTSLGAVTHARNERWQSAEAIWNDAVAKSPRDPTARLERGALFAQIARSDEALADFEEAVKLAPGSARAQVSLAGMLAARGRTRDALPHAREAVTLDPDSVAAHAELGRTLSALGDLAPAAAEFERALALGGEPGLERRLGDTLVRLRRYEDALPHYRAAIERDPGDDEARTGAGAALVELGRAREALGDLEIAVESQPNPFYLVHFADALWQLGDAGGALDAAAMAVRVAPTWPGATGRLAWMLALAPDAQRRDPARALRIADAALVRAPDPLLLSARAAAHAALGHFRDARADAERAAELARSAGDGTFADSLAEQAKSYARRNPWRDPPRPFEASP
jgi:tetratricopeptide (TPR) repeat protein